MQDAKISETTVTLNITDNLNKYKNLGGVAGENAGGGTLLKCTYQGTLGQANTTGAANVLDTVGGIVGLNNGEVNGMQCAQNHAAGDGCLGPERQPDLCGKAEKRQQRGRHCGP